MADIQDPEQEQIEAIKKWWKENGRVASIGLILGLGGVFGWSWWQSYSINKAERASVLYEELVNWASAQNFTQVNELAETLMRDFPNSGYAPLSGLIRASSAFSQNQPAEAKAYLQWVIDNARRPDLKNLARLRMAKLLAEDGDYQGSLTLLSQPDVGPLTATFQELRGDVLSAQDKTEEAAEAYGSTLDTEGISPTTQRRVEMKLADLGVSG